MNQSVGLGCGILCLFLIIDVEIGVENRNDSCSNFTEYDLCYLILMFNYLPPSSP